MKKVILAIFLTNIIIGYAQEILSFSKVEDLPNQWVNTIAQDSLGFIWVGTEDGLCRYDGSNFKVLRHSIEDRNSLTANSIYDIIVLKDEELLIGTQGGGISRFNLLKQEFNTLNKYANGKISYATNFYKLNDGIYVIVCDEGVLLYNIYTNILKKIVEGTTHSKVTAVNKNTFWFTNRKALYKYNIAEDKVLYSKQFRKEIKMLSSVNGYLLLTFDDSIISFNELGIQNEITTDDTILHVSGFKDKIIMASQEKLYRFDSDGFQVSNLKTSLDFKNYGINTIFLDKHNQLWVGTGKGLFKSKSVISIFNTPSISAHARRIIKHQDKLYAGGVNGLFKMDKNLKPHKILDDNILALRSFGSNLWIANITGYIFKIKNDSVVKKIAISSRYKYFRIYGLEQDRKNRIWAGCWSSGITVLDKEGDFLKQIPLNTNSNKGETKILKMLIDTKDRLWITTSAYGIFMLPDVSSVNLEQEIIPFKHYTYDMDDMHSINSDILFSVEEDKNNSIWFSTDLGIASYNENDDNFNRLRIDDELFNKKVMTIRCDANNNLWISTISDGLYVYRPESQKITNYTTDSGLISNAFLYTSGYYDDNDNILYFGTDTGIQTIDLNRPIHLNTTQQPVITDLNVNGKSRAFINMPYQNAINLTYKENDIAIQFSNLDLEQTLNNNYSYKLDHNDWYAMDAQTVYLSNLSYGEHLLQVKSNYSLNIKNANENIKNVTITITPPWYRTTIAYILYALIVLCGIILVVYLFLKTKIANIKTQKTKEVNELQSKMYANISHEFRTPLTIIGGLSKSLQKNNSQTNIIDSAKNIEKNSNQLLLLVNQMLDLVSLDAKQMEANYKQGDIIQFIKTVVSYYNALAESKDIILQFSSNTETCIMDFDDDKLQKIVNNLLSNAMKFTGENGMVSVEIRKENQQLQIQVKDNGAGIEKEHLPNIFNRYYKTFDLDKNIGSGIGMALTKELVKLMQGRINVKSDIGKGTKFYVTLPITHNVGLAKPNLSMPFIEKNKNLKEETNTQHIQVGTGFSILIVEDNYDIREYIKQLLNNTYNIYTANNGVEGIEITQTKSIDFIISDVTMPKMDGFEFCKKIKKNVKTSHIPFIIVSARTQTEAKLKGYELGVDAYLYKPFNEQELLLIIGNLLKKVEQTRKYFSKLLQLQQSEQPNIQQIDIDFIEQIQTYALSKNSKLSVDELAKSLYTSRSQLHRKIKALTGKSTTLYINLIRLEKAKTLLENTNLNINEIAYEVNFDDVAYFSKTFKKTYDFSPSKYREQFKNK